MPGWMGIGSCCVYGFLGLCEMILTGMASHEPSGSLEGYVLSVAKLLLLLLPGERLLNGVDRTWHAPAV